ncbi:MAG: putative glycoside hydrolase [Gammaproteobacteria bacterium]|nr:putative glycoside hydrolase [Gammaproteobacteria bacterium]
MRLWQTICITLIATFALVSNAMALSVRGIYVTSSTMEDRSYVNYLIKHAKASGINTFVVDVDGPSKMYRANIPLLKQNGIHYVARIVIFPQGGTADRIKSLEYREKKFNLVKLALAYGAEQIQLDYIRYNTSSGRSPQHVIDINNVIRWFKGRISVPLQIDVFGITSFGAEHHIGQDVRVFAQDVDVICPMNYPSHFEPFAFHSARPHETILNALESLKDQFHGKVPVKIITWIETSNYHYALTSSAKQKYIREQIRAVHDAGIDGWYAWSPSNEYDNLFRVLENSNTVETANR